MRPWGPFGLLALLCRDHTPAGDILRHGERLIMLNGLRLKLCLEDYYLGW
jgi:hypothetical protein